MRRWVPQSCYLWERSLLVRQGEPSGYDRDSDEQLLRELTSQGSARRPVFLNLTFRTTGRLSEARDPAASALRCAGSGAPDEE